MNFQPLHRWDLDYASARELQNQLRGRLDLSPRPLTPKLVAGCDVSCEKGGRRLHAAVVVMETQDFQALEFGAASFEADFPYIPGLLSFREMPVMLAAFEQIRLTPCLIFCDGSGAIHPRGFGLACHLGLWLNTPTIGCAKNLLCGECEEPGWEKGAWTPVRLEGITIGASLRTRTGVKPVFVSPGNLISLEQVVGFTLKACRRFRLPQPIRTAHAAASLAKYISEQREGAR